MYDSETISLIQNAPQLDGIDLNDLPQRLTEAYSSIVSARMRLREAVGTDAPDNKISTIKSEMNRLAFTYEALVSVRSDRENRSSAAFIAGTAHHVVSLATTLLNKPSRVSSLNFQAISPEVSSALLFLIAEAHADAAEVAKGITIQTDDIVEAALLKSIKHLAEGKLRNIIKIPVPDPKDFLDTPDSSKAVRTLYHLLFQGVRALALRMLGKDSEANLTDLDPYTLFSHVRGLCVEPLDDLFSEDAIPPRSLFPGPLHLASLLTAVARDLPPSAVVNVPPPTGLDGHRWSHTMRKIAARKPYLWRNHRQAIARGYLEPGCSAVVSFPTGAGKSTLAELKIASALLRNSKVLFLAPTLALVDQTSRTLSEAYPQAKVHRERAEDLLFDIENETLPSISVMTPERCLSIMSFDRTFFSEIGLLVFDECHLLHPRETDNSHRAIDAMLCILNIFDIAPGADVLFLSAMILNCEEIAGWLASITNRPCLPLTLTWKPTRQVRGCVVYDDDEIKALNDLLKKQRAQLTSIDAPKRVKSALIAHPFGLFCLRQTWQSKARADYAHLPLIENTVTLSSGTANSGSWYLTPNGNQVASAIAHATAKQHLKTLVFTQTIPLANSASKALCSSLGKSICRLTDGEMALYEIATDEAGGKDYIYLEVDTTGELISSCACHHGLLLPSERHLHEALFKRKDGIDVLVATSTLAQGMNLPSQVVIISGDSRFDTGAGRIEKLEAHELLNAAGRAGRAGDNSHGFVLIVPSKVIYFNNTESTIHRHWSQLQSIFAQSDQCLTVDDPFTALLDHIHNGTHEYSPLTTYFIRRLPIGNFPEEDADTPARILLRRSFAAYRARVSGNQSWIDERIEAAINFRHADPEAPKNLTWADRLAASTGIPVAVIRELGEPLAGQIRHEAQMLEWYRWLVSWLNERPHLLPKLIRRESLESVLPSEFKSLDGDGLKGQYISTHVFPLLSLWMEGNTLAELEVALGTQGNRIGKCERAREFVLRIVPELAYLFSLPRQILRALTAERDEAHNPPLGLDILGFCVREGLDSVEKLALRQLLKGNFHRRAVHRQYEIIKQHIKPPTPGETFASIINRVENAVEAASHI